MKDISVLSSEIGDVLWEENFDGYQGAINSDYWNHDVGRGPNSDGWGNQELQTYTNETSNVKVDNGNLEITAIRDGTSFTSGRINTKDKVLFKYATIEARIQFPDVIEGLWPSFWTLGSDFDQVSWPAAGEIDIVELGAGSSLRDGAGNSRITSGAHWAANDDQQTLEAYALHPDYPHGDVAGPNSGFLTYKMVWTPTKITTWVVNDNPMIVDFKLWEIDIDAASCPGCQDEFHKEHFLIMNLAVGGLFTTIPRDGESSSSSSSSSNGDSNFHFTPVECDSHSSFASASSSSSGCGEEEGFVPRTEVSAPLPATMKVDYVRIFQNGFTEVTVVDATTPTSEPTSGPTSYFKYYTSDPSSTPSSNPTNYFKLNPSEPTAEPSSKTPSPAPVSQGSVQSPKIAPLSEAPTSAVTSEGSRGTPTLAPTRNGPSSRPSVRGSRFFGYATPAPSSSSSGKSGSGKSGTGKSGTRKSGDGSGSGSTTSSGKASKNPTNKDRANRNANANANAKAKASNGQVELMQYGYEYVHSSSSSLPLSTFGFTTAMSMVLVASIAFLLA